MRNWWPSGAISQFFIFNSQFHEAGGRFTAKVATEDREPAQYLLLPSGEQAPGLGEDGAQAAMALRHIARRGGQKIKVARDLPGDLRTREHPHPRRRELDRQRQPLDEPADLHHARSL